MDKLATLDERESFLPVYLQVGGIQHLLSHNAGPTVASGRPLQHLQRIPIAHQDSLTPQIGLYLYQLSRLTRGGKIGWGSARLWYVQCMSTRDNTVNAAYATKNLDMIRAKQTGDDSIVHGHSMG